MDTNFFDDLSKKVIDALPPGLKEMKEGFEKQIKVILHSAFSQLDLVTRQEFDRQIAVLVKTRAKVDALEKRLNDFEIQNQTQTKVKTHKKTQEKF